MNALQELARCRNVKFEGFWRDPEGRYPVIPIFELTEPSVQEWNRMAASHRKAEVGAGYDEWRETV